MSTRNQKTVSNRDTEENTCSLGGLGLLAVDKPNCALKEGRIKQMFNHRGGDHTRRETKD